MLSSSYYIHFWVYVDVLRTWLNVFDRAVSKCCRSYRCIISNLFCFFKIPSLWSKAV